jgi:hypothetical protein
VWTSSSVVPLQPSPDVCCDADVTAHRIRETAKPTDIPLRHDNEGGSTRRANPDSGGFSCRRRAATEKIAASARFGRISPRGIYPVRSGCQTAKPLGPLACLAEALERLNAREEVRLRPSGASSRQPSPAFMSEGWWTRTAPVGTKSKNGSASWMRFAVRRDAVVPSQIQAQTTRARAKCES